MELFDYSLLETLGFKKDINDIAYNKYIYDKDRNPISIDFTFFYLHDIPRMRIFYNDHSNWFDIKNFEQVKMIYDYYTNMSYQNYKSVDLGILRDMGFTLLYGPEYEDIFVKKFEKFEMTIIGGYWVHTKYKVNPPYNEELNYDYISSKDELDSLINFYDAVL